MYKFHTACKRNMIAIKNPTYRSFFHTLGWTFGFIPKVLVVTIVFRHHRREFSNKIMG